MTEVTGDIWKYPAEVVMVTTNGQVKRGYAVMGAGLAKQANQIIPSASYELGKRIMRNGNIVQLIGLIPDGYPARFALSFPTKEHWKDPSPLWLIEQSAQKLQSIALSEPEVVFVMPRPGTGLGGRTWEEVKQYIKPLPDNVHVITPATDR